MTRRHRESAAGSLELLLDTICNTFGGVLFLAMLVSLLLAQSRRRIETDETTSDPRPAFTPAELTRLDIAAEELSAEVERLGRAIERARAVAVDFSVPNLPQQLADLENQERARDRLAAERTRSLGELAATQAAVARARLSVAAAVREKNRIEAAIEAAQERLNAAVEERQLLVRSAIDLQAWEATKAALQTTGRAPRERQTAKREFGVLLRYGRMYLMKTLRGQDLVVNESDFFVELGESHNVARPKPHAGLDIARSSSIAAELTERLRPFPAESWYPCLVVYPDSFEPFLALKVELVAQGYEYRLLPTDGSVVDRGGRGAVQ
jgi:hypothetical protein